MSPNNLTAPCRGCPDRVVGCHSTCEKYLEFDKENKILREKKIQIAESNWIQNDIERRRIRMFQKKKFCNSRRPKE